MTEDRKPHSYSLDRSDTTDGGEDLGTDTVTEIDGLQGDNDESESLRRRLDAIERAVGGDGSIEERTDRIDELEARVAELEAATQAIRGYVGTVKHVNEEIERRADLALRKVATLERHVDGSEVAADDDTGGGQTPGERPTNDTDAASEEASETGDEHEQSTTATEPSGRLRDLL
ncbi:MAG: hypothetical protein PPP58_09005 [Natronomonas sp.]